jgi:hypothetical protein
VPSRLEVMGVTPIATTRGTEMGTGMAVVQMRSVGSGGVDPSGRRPLIPKTL